MYIDPVVQEIRHQKAEIAQECGGDLDRMIDRFRKEQEQHPHRVVNLRKRFSPGEKPPTSTQATPD
jgi:hypothetical protein